MPIKKKMYQQVASKGLKTKILERDVWLKRYIPKTVWYRDDLVVDMLNRYGLLYVKPDKGGGGGGIVRVKKIGEKNAECKSLVRKKVVPIPLLPALLQSWFRPNKRYLIQEGISLATIHNRPFDIRLMLQRMDQDWELTGIAAKIAAPGKIVTNFCKGGQPYAAHEAVSMVCGKELKFQKMAELKKMAYKVAEVLSKHFRGLRELGIDAGLDKNGHIWIFEVNTRPTIGMFSKLRDLQMYYKIRKKHLQLI